MKPIADAKIVLSKHDPAAMRLISRRPIEGDRVTISGRLGDSAHTVRLIVEHRAAKYRVVSVTVDAQEDGEITSALLGIAVKEAADAALALAWSLFSATADSTTTDQATEASARHRADFMRQQRRRSLDDPLMRRVAEVYRAAEAEGATPLVAAVEREFYVSRAQAERYVREARRRGFLPPSKRRRKAP